MYIAFKVLASFFFIIETDKTSKKMKRIKEEIKQQLKKSIMSYKNVNIDPEELAKKV